MVGGVVNATFSLTVTGDGRNDTLTITPITGQTSATTSPPGAMNTMSPISFELFQLAAGDNTICSPGGLYPLNRFTDAGMTPKYLVIRPPSGSTNAKFLSGAAGELGLAVLADKPIILALPSSTDDIVNYTIVINSTGTETVDVLIF